MSTTYREELVLLFPGGGREARTIILQPLPALPFLFDVIWTITLYTSLSKQATKVITR